MLFRCHFTGHGFGIGTAAGRLVSQMVLAEKTEPDLSALRYDRFSARI